MQIVLPRSWKEEFAAVAAKREDILHKEKMVRHEDRERQRRKEDRLDDERQDADMMAVVDVVLATTQEVAEFRVQLNEYDAKTVEALMENREALEAARERVATLLEDAYVLPDGRKAFKTKDGLRVFDEHGVELSSDVIDPDSIEDSRSFWETYDAAVKDEVRLKAVQRDLLDYQAKLDAARERLDEGDITKKELEKIEADLAAEMPESVREKLGLDQQKADAGSAKETTAAKPALPTDMDSLMRQTGLGAGPAGPS